jgi:predicted outer membrane repeat protein
MYRVLAAACFLALVAASNHAAAQCIYTVNDAGDGALGPSGLSYSDYGPYGRCESGPVGGTGPCTLRAALELANGASGCVPPLSTVKIIYVDVDNIVLTGPSNPTGSAYPLNDDVGYANPYVIQPAAPRTRFTIESQYTDSRAFELFTNEVWLRNVTVRNFQRSDTGAFALVRGGTLTCENCIVENNQAASGGAVYVENGAFLAINTVFRNNQALAGAGGAISILNGSFFALRSVFDGNSASSVGGAISHPQTGQHSIATQVHNSLFINNRAQSAGGAIYTNTTSGGAVYFSTLANNRAEGPSASFLAGGTGTGTPSVTGPVGGGVYAVGQIGALELANSIVSGNETVVGATRTADDCGVLSGFGQVTGFAYNIIGALGNCNNNATFHAEPVSFQPYDSTLGRLGLFPGAAVDSATGVANAFACDYVGSLSGFGANRPTPNTRAFNAPDRLNEARPIGGACDLGAFEYKGTDVGLTLNAPLTSWLVGSDKVFTLDLTRAGPEMAHPGTLNLSVSSGGVIAAVSGLTCSGLGTGTVACSVPASSASQSVSVTTTANAAAAITLTSGLSSYGDSNPGNDSATLTRSSQALTAASGAFTCDHIIDSISGENDDEYKLRLRVTNNSGGAASASTASIEWDSRLSFVSSDPRCTFDEAAKRATCDGGVLPTGTSTSFAITVRPAELGVPSVLQTCTLTLSSGVVSATSRFGIEVIQAPAQEPGASGSGTGDTPADGQNIDRTGSLDITKQKQFRCGSASDGGFFAVLAALWLLRRRRVAGLVLGLGIVSLSSQASAQCTYVVNDAGDADDPATDFTCETATGNGLCTLRAAIKELAFCQGMAGPTGTIEIDVDTITVSNEASTGAGYAMLLNPNSGTHRTIIAPTGARSSFTITSASSDLQLWRQTQGETLVRDATISGFVSTILTGGAVARLSGGTFSCERCIIDNNVATGAGGAFSAGNSYLFLIDSILSRNRSTTSSGGAVYMADTGLFVVRSVFDGNESNFLGGAISQPSSGYVSGAMDVHNSLFINNRARAAGGAIYQHSTSGGGLYYSTIANNSVEGSPIYFTHGYFGPGPAGVTGPTGAGLYKGFPTGGAFSIANSLFGGNRTVTDTVSVNNDCGTIDSLSASAVNVMAEPVSCANANIRQATQAFQPYDTTTHRLGLFPGPGVDGASGSCDDTVVLATASSSAGPSLPQPQTRAVNNPDRQNDPRPVGTTCDLGAFEYKGTDLALSFTGPNDTWLPGATKTFSLAMTHNGPEMNHAGSITISTASDAVIDDVTGLTCSGLGTSNVTCDKPAAASTAFANVTLSAGGPGAVTLSAALAAYGDSNQANDVASITRNVASAPQTSFICDHIVDSITGSVADDYALRLRIINNSGADATASSASLEWTTNLTFVSADVRCSFDANNKRVSCIGGPLANGATETFSVVVKPADLGQPLVIERCALTLASGQASETNQFAIEVIDANAAAGSGGPSGVTGDGQDVDAGGILALANKRGRGGGGCRGSAVEPSFLAALGALWLLRRRSRPAT